MKTALKPTLPNSRELTKTIVSVQTDWWLYRLASGREMGKSREGGRKQKPTGSFTLRSPKMGFNGKLRTSWQDYMSDRDDGRGLAQIKDWWEPTSSYLAPPVKGLFAFQELPLTKRFESIAHFPKLNAIANPNPNPLTPIR
ncbi:hypothetical protein EYF80_018384 [Liparis tanakae]|uniref:Uncharacterized protein n=1 Tax=Liparis tanakae TaxID=230148 RepID=A0A4Z2I1U8_9TELE|nr:hypothetical protein EYF80_018384 [Liparis tanakae]